MAGLTLSGGWPDRRPPVRTTPQIGPDHPPNRAGPPHKSGRPPVRTTSKSGRTTAPKWSGHPGQGGWAKGSGPFFAVRTAVRTVFCGSGPFFAGRTAVRTVFCGSGPNGRPSARGPDMRAGPRASRGGQPGGRPRRKSGRTNPRIGPDGRPDHPPNRAGRVAGRASGRRPPPLCGMRAQPEIGLTGVFFAHFFCGGRERCTFPTAQWP